MDTATIRRMFGIDRVVMVDRRRVGDGSTSGYVLTVTLCDGRGSIWLESTLGLVSERYFFLPIR